jgi:transposase
MSVMGASKELGVSESTVRRWVKKGKLKGRLFVQERSCFVLSLLGIILKGKV